MYQKILLPIDGSENAKRAVEDAISIADLSGAEIIVLYVIETYYLDGLPHPDLQENLEEVLREDGKRAVEHFKDNLAEAQCEGKCKNTVYTIEIRKGRPAHEILQTIEEQDIDLVVIGASGKHSLERFLLGSTAEEVSGSTIIPIKVVY